MDHSDILTLFDRDLRRKVTYPHAIKEDVPPVVRFIQPKPSKSFVLYSDLTAETADDAIQAQLAYFKARDLLFEWKVYGHDRPADLGERLVAAGLVGEKPEAVMVLDLAEMPEALRRPVQADVRRLTSPDQLDDVIAVLESVWGEDFSWVHSRLGGHMLVPGHISVYVGYVAEHPVSVGWTYFPAGQFATLWAGSTVEAFRGQGLYSSLVATRLQEALQRGKRLATLDAGPMSEPIVKRHGFRVLTTAAGYEWPANDQTGPSD